MSANDRKEWRKKRIEGIETGGGVTDLTIKQSVDVLNSVVEDLTGSIDKNSQSSSRLALVVAVCTFLLVAIGAVDLYIRIFDICAKCP